MMFKISKHSQGTSHIEATLVTQLTKHAVFYGSYFWTSSSIKKECKSILSVCCILKKYPNRKVLERDRFTTKAKLLCEKLEAESKSGFKKIKKNMNFTLNSYKNPNVLRHNLYDQQNLTLYEFLTTKISCSYYFKFYIPKFYRFIPKRLKPHTSKFLVLCTILFSHSSATILR